MYATSDRLVIFDADGTLIDSFRAIENAFETHGMDIGDLQRFQKRRKLLKYLGGLREFPKNLRRHFSKENRKHFKHTLTDIYRSEAKIFPGLAALLQQLVAAPNIKVGIVSRNVTIEPETTIRTVLDRHGIDSRRLDFLHCIDLGDEKSTRFRKIREGFGINPSLSIACGDEYRDYASAIESGISPIMVSYGFEDHGRLTEEFRIPAELIAKSSDELTTRIVHTLALEP